MTDQRHVIEVVEARARRSALSVMSKPAGPMISIGDAEARRQAQDGAGVLRNVRLI